MIVPKMKTQLDKIVYEIVTSDELKYVPVKKPGIPNTKKDNNKVLMSDGEKLLIYDLVHRVQKYLYFDWRYINMVELVKDIRDVYFANSNLPEIKVIAACINYISPDKKATILESTYEPPEIYITKRKRGEKCGKAEARLQYSKLK